MKHMIAYPAKTILDSMAIRWSVTEKFDGSYIRMSIDESGRFYTTRKGNVRYYDVNDWPKLAWTNDFRQVHIVLQNFHEMLTQVVPFEHHLKPGEFMDFEIIAGRQPNAIKYPKLFENSLILLNEVHERQYPYQFFDYVNRTSASEDVLLTAGFPRKFSTVRCDQIVSHDGITLQTEKRIRDWHFLLPETNSLYSGNTNERSQLEEFLTSRVILFDHKIEMHELLDIKLNRKPLWLDPKVWADHRLAFIMQAKAARESAEAEYLAHYSRVSRSVAEFMLDYDSGRSIASYEGSVIESSDWNNQPIQFKLVDRPHFSALNNFAHIVRYWLQGGRRPERPCFLSRTQHWPIQKRLDRLEVLRQRFVNSKMVGKFGPYEFDYSEPQVYQRTLVLFAEIRERIINGRTGIQGPSTTNSEGRDSGNPELVGVEDQA